MNHENRVEMALWMAEFSVVAHIARYPQLAALIKRIMRLAAWQNLKFKHGRPQTTLRDMVCEWQRMLPTTDINRIQSIDNATAYAQVHVHCPLRGTGDIMACYRLMEYDRAMLEIIGGQLVVLKSQAEPGRDVCEVALRLQGADMSDLRAAHQNTTASLKP